MRKTLVVIIFLAAAAVVAVLLTRGTEPGSQDKAASETQAESKLLSLTFEDADGNDVTLVDFSGTPLVVNSWAIWCPFCVEELKDFAAIQQEFGDSVAIIAINRAESRNRAQTFVEELGVAEDLIFWQDGQDTFYQTIGGFSMPETVFIDANGALVDHKRGFMSAQEMRQKIQQAFDL